MQTIGNNSQAILGFYLCGITHPKDIQSIERVYGSISKAWEIGTSIHEMALPKEKSELFRKARKTIDIKKTLALLNENQISVLTIVDDAYPSLLKEIADPPPLLFLRGSSTILSAQHCVSIVGTRKPTWYGKAITQKIADDLAEQGIAAVSGLAYGVDAIVHSRYSEKHVPTIAVLAGGIDNETLYPKTHLALAKKIIADGGAVISEHTIGTPALPHQFPQRNRIISGLSRGTVIIEGAYQSGACITARFALEQNREVLAVPGCATSIYSEGPNDLIRSGAHLVRTAKDICDDLSLPYQNNEKKPGIALSPTAKKIMSLISFEPIHIDKLIQASTLEPSTCVAAVTELEMAELVTSTGGGWYTKHI